MKKIRLVGVLLLVLFLTACVSNRQESTVSDANKFIAALPDFKELVQYFSVEAVSVGAPIRPPLSPQLYESEPKMGEKGAPFVHVVIYRTKAGDVKLVLLNDAIPPKIVAIKSFK